MHGYPGTVYEHGIEKDAEHCMYGNYGKWAKESENRLRYAIPTSAGQSGSPAYVKKA